MATPLHVEVVAVDQQVFSGEVDLVVARTSDGEVGILHGHAPLLGALADDSAVRLVTGGGETRVALAGGGFLSVTPDGVQVLAESARVEQG